MKKTICLSLCMISLIGLSIFVLFFNSDDADLAPHAELIGSTVPLEICKKCENFISLKEGNLPYVFVLDLGRYARIKKIRLEFGENYPTEFSLNSVSYNSDILRADHLSKLIEISNHASSIFEMNFNPPLPATYLRFNASKFSAAPELIIRQFKIISDPPDEIQKLLLKPGAEEVVFSGNDPSNPLSVFGIPVRRGVVDVANLLSKNKKSEHEKIVAFMNLLNTHSVSLSPKGTPEETLLKNMGSCGTWVNTLLALSRAMGNEGRLVGLSNYPKNNGHTVTEIKVRGRWQLYDPTFGLYYTSEPENTENPYILSFDELHAGGAQLPGVVRVIRRVYGAGTDNFADPIIFQKADPAGIIGPNHPMIFPLTLAAGQTLDKRDFDPRNQGADYIGAAYANHNQRFRLTALIPGKRYSFNINPSYIHDEESLSKAGNPSFSLTVQLQGTVEDSRQEHVFHLEKDSSILPWRIEFTARTTEAFITITHPYRGPLNRYLGMESWALEAIENELKQPIPK